MINKPPKLPTSWSEALRTGHSRYYTGKACQRGHLSQRHASTGGCLQCMKEDRKGKYKITRKAYLKAYKKKLMEEGRKARAVRRAALEDKLS